MGGGTTGSTGRAFRVAREAPECSARRGIESVNRPGIPVAPAMQLVFSPVVAGPHAPGVLVEWWSTAGGEPQPTGKRVIVPAAQAAALVDALRSATTEATAAPSYREGTAR
jgi:hypothetical protein